MKDVNFFTAQIKLWARIFDYKGRSTRKEYWFPFILHVVLGILEGVSIVLSFIPVTIIHYFFLVIAVGLLMYLSLSIIPWISLTVRRLRDAGKSAWWTVLLLVFGIGHIFLFFLCSLASTAVGYFNPIENFPAGVYGPPEMYDVDDNFNGNVYGPPPFDIEEDDNDYDPSENEPVDVYGPPLFDDEEFDPEANDQGEVYGPPVFDEEEFEPAVNMQPAVYGPPEMFDDEEGE